MQDIAMISLELLINAQSAQATQIHMHYQVNPRKNKVKLSVIDDGNGMDEETLKKVSSPFYSGRSTRKIGLGLPFFIQSVQQCDGQVNLSSTWGHGTRIEGQWSYDHWDNPPEGNLGECILLCIQANPKTQIVFTYQYQEAVHNFDSKKLQEMIDPLPLDQTDILLWIEQEINQQIKTCKGA